MSRLSQVSTVLGEIPEFIIPSLKAESKTRLLSVSSSHSLTSCCSSVAPSLESTSPLLQKERSPCPRRRRSLGGSAAVNQMADRRFSEQVRSTMASAPLSQRKRELFPACSSPVLTIKRKSRAGLDGSNPSVRVVSSLSLSADREPSTPELLSRSIFLSDEEPATEEDGISLSASYSAHKRTLRFSINDLNCGTTTVGNNQSKYLVKLTLNSYKQRHLLQDIHSSDDTGVSILPSKRVVFKGVKSSTLSSTSLTIKVYTKKLWRAGKLLYSASTPLADVPLTGDANWVPVKPIIQQKTSSVISCCMCYNACKKKLMITVVNAKHLKMSVLRKDSYVEVKLFRRGGAENEAMQTVRTKCHQGGSNPVYKKAFSFDFTADGSDDSRYAELTFTVRRKGLLRADKVLGKVTLSSDLQLRWKKSESLKNTLDEVFRYPGKVITQSHDLSTSS